MAADVNIEIRLKVDKAIASASKLNAVLTATAEKNKRARIRTEQFANSLNQKLSASTLLAAERLKQAAIRSEILSQKLRKVGDSGKKASRGLGTANIAMASFIGNITSRIVSSGITTLVNGLRRIVTAGIAFEDGIINVGKTTGISGRALESLGNEITEISKKIPVTTTKLLEIATVAGQLGLKSSADILTFTETLGKLQLATDITGTEGSQSVAKILTITGELKENGSENIRTFGSVITRLGNNFAATESQILKVANRVAQGAASFGVASTDILAIATALKATGSEAEASGTAVQKVFKFMGEAATEGNEKLRRFSEATGLTDQGFKDLLKSDPAALFVRLTKTLGQSGLKGAELNKVLKDLGIVDVRLSKSLNPLITQHETLSRAISDARREAIDRVALDEEAAKAAKKLSSDLILLSNEYDALAKTIFKDASPAMKGFTQALRGLIKVADDTLKNETIRTLTDHVTTFTVHVLKSNTAVKILVDSFNALKDSAPEEEFEGTSEATKTYLGNLSDLITVTEEYNGPLLTQVKLLKEVRDNYVEVAKAAGGGLPVQKELLLFEREKTKKLKQFFKEQEQAELESIFKTLKSKVERDAFEKLIASQGNQRLDDGLKKKLGIDKATIDAERKTQQELKRIREMFADLEKESNQLKEQDKLVELENDTIFTDQKLINLQEFFTRREEVEIQGKLNSGLNEQERQAFLLEIQNEGQKRRIDNEIAAAEELKTAKDVAQKIIDEDNAQLVKLEKKKNQAILQSSAGLFGALANVARTGGAKALEAYKVFATAQAVISTYAAINKTLAEPALVWPANVIQATAIGLQGAANVISIQQQSFEHGGIVGGSSFTGDKVGANVNSGEMILTRQQQNQLFKMASGQSSSSSDKPINITVQSVLDGEVISESVSRHVANGLILGEVQ